MSIAKALVVDDSRVAHVLLNKLLKERGIEVDWVGSGQDAISYLKSQKSDVVFMDVMMPGMDGFQTADAISKDSTVNAPPIIMCSANATEEDQETASKCGAKGFLSKPYTPDELDQVLEMVSNLPPAVAEASIPESSIVEEKRLEPETNDALDFAGSQLESIDLPDLEPEPTPEPLTDKLITSDSEALTSKEVSNIARKIATQAVESSAESIARRIATEVAQKVIEEAAPRIAKDVAHEARETAQTAAVEAARAVAKQAMKIVSEKIPNAETIRSELAKGLETQVSKHVQTALGSDDFKTRINQLVRTSAQPVVESMTRQAAEAAAQATAENAARQVSEEVALSVAEEVVKSNSKSANMRANLALFLSLVAIAAAAVFKFIIP